MKMKFSMMEEMRYLEKTMKHIFVLHVLLKKHCFLPEGWKVNKIKYLKLNNQLHIDEDVTLWDLVKKDVKYKAKKMFKGGKRKLQVN
jgi:hypothetical protein